MQHSDKHESVEAELSSPEVSEMHVPAPTLNLYPTRAIDSLLNASGSSSVVQYQDASLDVWDSKYRLKNKDKKNIDNSINDTLLRTAARLASVEKEPAKWLPIFTKALMAGAIPAGRILSNAGAEAEKPSASLINCVVSGTITDSMDDILAKVHEAGMTLKAGCGIGYEFSTLRPRDAFVEGVGAQTSGPITFMDIYDKMCFTVSSAGGRRGAQMATFDINHPDVEEFITAKREDGRLRQFNLSLLITQPFIDAVAANADWKLSFPMTQKEYNSNLDPIQGLRIEYVTRHMPWITGKEYAKKEDGALICKVYKTIKAQKLWDLIMKSTYDFAEPGFIMIDKVNEYNNNWFCEDIRATNPCGEQPLPPYGSCLLGSLNLSKFVRKPFTKEASFDWPAFRETVTIFTRMLDNVVELNGLPLSKQENEIRRKRRHGMGFLGLGSTFSMLGMTYGDEDSVEFTESVSYQLAIAGWEAGVELAKEKGPAPIMIEEFLINEELLAKQSSLSTSYKKGDRVSGVDLFLHSSYMAQFAATEDGRNLLENIRRYGCRFTHHSSIAPTGTISLSIGNNASNGLEPTFSHKYYRNMIVPGRNTKERVDVYSFELLAYMQYLRDKGESFDPDNLELPECFVTTDNIKPKAHVDIQAASQRWVDSSISKTCNVPTEIDYEEFKDVYLYAVKMGLKGCTTFRFNPAAFQGVLVTEKDLKGTIYSFTLDDGSTVSLAGDEMVEYNGQVQSVANLGDAIKEGVYGKL